MINYFFNIVVVIIKKKKKKKKKIYKIKTKKFYIIYKK